MILFDNWRIKYVGELLAHQYDNLSRTLLVKGVPDGYDWAMMVQIKEYFDVIALAPMEEGVGVVLTEEQLSLDGYYSMQLVGTLKDDGVTKRHTNALQVYVGASLSGDANWPEVPSEFSQMEDRIRELNSHPPVPGTQGYWLIWDPDKDAYVESELPLPEGSGGGSVDVDATLTQSGKAADAAAVGDALSSLSEEIASVPGGKDGVSPTASVEHIEGGVVLTVEDARGTTTATLHDGATGPAGPQGETGPQGPAGADGLGVPVATAEDAGKVPVVQSDMTYKLEKPSGGGIDLTGASVGQIPRIAIVDDSGKPTAWEAADISCELIASVTLKESAATVEFTGLNLGVGSYTIIIRNTGTLTGAGLSISLNGITKAGYTGVFYNDSGITSANISVLGSYTLGMSFMSNGGKNKYMWDSVTLPITSISVFSPYHLTDETKYFSDGTVVVIYRGVINYNM